MNLPRVCMKLVNTLNIHLNYLSHYIQEMAVVPSFLPVLEKFGLNPSSLNNFLQITQGFIAGGAASSAFFGKPLEDDQDLNIWIPLPISPCLQYIYTASGNCIAVSYSYLVREFVTNFFTKNQNDPSAKNLLSMSLQTIINRYKGVYRLTTNNDKNPYDNFSASGVNESIANFENPWTGRRIKIVYTQMCNVLDNFDLDICQFYVDGTSNFMVKIYNKNIDNLTNLRHGQARILNNHKYNQSRYESLDKLIIKYEKRGYTFTYASSGIPYRVPKLCTVPTESFWQDIEISTNDFIQLFGENFSKNLSQKPLHDLFLDILNETGCNFDGCDTEGNIDVLVNYYMEQLKEDSSNGDIWLYTWRFTWDDDGDNIYLRSMVLQNLY